MTGKWRGLFGGKRISRVFREASDWGLFVFWVSSFKTTFLSLVISWGRRSGLNTIWTSDSIAWDRYEVGVSMWKTVTNSVV